MTQPLSDDMETIMNIFRRLEPEARVYLFRDLQYNDEFCVECG